VKPGTASGAKEKLSDGLVAAAEFGLATLGAVV
jgi:hypothetical protein